MASSSGASAPTTTTTATTTAAAATTTTGPESTSLSRLTQLVVSLTQSVIASEAQQKPTPEERARKMQPIADACNEAHFELEKYINVLKSATR